jgi:hypothetical protein
MIESRTLPSQCGLLQTAQASRILLWTETVFSRFPIHNPTIGGVTIRITRTNTQGELDLCWAVSYNDAYGPSRHLACKRERSIVATDAEGQPDWCLHSTHGQKTSAEYAAFRRQHSVETALPLPEELAVLEAEARVGLVAEGTPAVALSRAVRVAVDMMLAAQAGLPSFEVWQQRQEGCR